MASALLRTPSTKYLRATARHPRTIACLVSEYLTSKACWRCASRCSLQGRQAVCPNCPARLGPTDRDAQGAINIGKLALLGLTRGVRPLQYIAPQRWNKHRVRQLRTLGREQTLDVARRAMQEGRAFEEALRLAHAEVAPVRAALGGAAFFAQDTTQQVASVYGIRVAPWHAEEGGGAKGARKKRPYAMPC